MKLRLLARRERWSLTWQGTLALAGLGIFIAIALRFEAYPFLAVNRPVPANVMILESWIDKRVLRQVAADFRQRHYDSLLYLQPVYGSELESDGPGDSTLGMLVECGVPSELVSKVNYPAVERDRTYHAALAARAWFTENRVPVTSVNVVTEGPHARRSWLLYEKVFAREAKVGIVALKDPMYDPNHWWRTSEGVREVLGETIAYVYARFLFNK